MAKLLHQWRAFQVFLDCCPVIEEEKPAPWSAADADWLRRQLGTPEGQRLLGKLRSAVHYREASACMTKDHGEHARGVALGWRAALSHIITISQPSTATPKEESEFVLPGAQHDLATRLSP